jgi:N-acetyl-anhydromuramyl-L-alanine amidase AmpD
VLLISIYDQVYSSPNFGYPKGAIGRKGHQVIAICLHITGAAWQSNYSWIMNPKANASYNAIVKDDGTVVSLVPEGSAAYSHGKINKATWPLLKAGVNPNLYTLSLARTGSNQNRWTAAQLASTLKVLRHWGKAYNIPLRRPYIFGHFEIDSVDRWYCPGRPFFDRVIAELAQEQQAAGVEASEPVQNSITPSTAPVEVPVQQAAVWYRVVAGSYRNRVTAEQEAAKLKAQGLNAFVAPYSEPT